MNDRSLAALIQKCKEKSPAKLAGLFCLLCFITACQTAKSPEQVTTAFWQAIAQGDLDTAKELASPETRQLVRNEPKLENASLQIGQIIINGFNGFIIANAEQAVTTIMNIVHDTPLHEKLIAGAFATAQNYHADITTKQLLKFYHSTRS